MGTSNSNEQKHEHEKERLDKQKDKTKFKNESSSNPTENTNQNSLDTQFNNGNDILAVKQVNNNDDINQKKLSKILWIDPNVNNTENNFYKSYIQENYPKTEIFSFDNVDNAIKNIKSLSFEDIFVIISGRLYKEFILKFINNLIEIKVIPKIIIFTGNRDKFIEFNKDLNKKILTNKFYFLGDIRTTFDDILNFLTSDNWKTKLTLNEVKYEGEESNELTFEYVESLEALMLPRFFRTLIKLNEKDNLDELNQYLFNKYSDSVDLKDLLNQLEGIPSIPYEILCKYYARLYTIESDFYKDINKKLRKKSLKSLEYYKNKNYALTFVKLLYEGLKLKCFKSKSKKELYRGGIISKSEKILLDEYLNKKKEGLPGAICFSKAFLSFSENRRTAEAFLKERYLENSNNKDLLNILFILRKNENITKESLYTYINLSDIAKIKEYEILFLPFSPFEIESIKEIKGENLTYYIIELDYLDKYTEKLEKIKNNKKLIDTSFGKQFAEIGLVEETKIQNITPNNLIQNAFIFEYKYKENEKKISNKEYGEHITKGPNKELIYFVKKEDIDENGEVQILGEHINGDDFLKLNKDKSHLIINGKKEQLCYKYKLPEGINKIEIVFEGKVTNYRAMFKYCTSLVDISPLEFWDVKDATCFSCSLRGCTSLVDLSPLRNWDLSNVEDLNACFDGDIALTDLSPLKNWNVSKVNLMSATFSHCTSLSDISPLRRWDVKNVHNLSRLFDGCINLKDISPLKNWQVGNCKNFNCIFRECSSLSDITPLANWDVSKGLSFDEFFKNCISLRNITPLKNWDTNNGNSFNSFFENCIKLTDITPIDGWNVSKRAGYHDLFKGASITTITSSSWYSSKNK